MLKYNPHLKQIARRLRKEMTASERTLWSSLRRKQLNDTQFYRQKPIGSYIVDFYAPQSKLVVEVDGSQHLGSTHSQNYAERDCLKGAGLQILRFNNIQILQELDAVVEVILQALRDSSGRDSLNMEAAGENPL